MAIRNYHGRDLRKEDPAAAIASEDVPAELTRRSP